MDDILKNASLTDPAIVTRDDIDVDTRDLKGEAARIALVQVTQALNAVFGYNGAFVS